MAEAPRLGSLLCSGPGPAGERKNSPGRRCLAFRREPRLRTGTNPGPERGRYIVAKRRAVNVCARPGPGWSRRPLPVTKRPCGPCPIQPSLGRMEEAHAEGRTAERGRGGDLGGAARRAARRPGAARPAPEGPAAGQRRAAPPDHPDPAVAAGRPLGRWRAGRPNPAAPPAGAAEGSAGACEAAGDRGGGGGAASRPESPGPGDLRRDGRRAAGDRGGGPVARPARRAGVRQPRGPGPCGARGLRGAARPRGGGRALHARPHRPRQTRLLRRRGRSEGPGPAADAPGRDRPVGNVRGRCARHEGPRPADRLLDQVRPGREAQGPAERAEAGSLLHQSTRRLLSPDVDIAPP